MKDSYRVTFNRNRTMQEIINVLDSQTRVYDAQRIFEEMMQALMFSTGMTKVENLTDFRVMINLAYNGILLTQKKRYELNVVSPMNMTEADAELLMDKFGIKDGKVMEEEEKPVPKEEPKPKTVSGPKKDVPKVTEEKSDIQLDPNDMIAQTLLDNNIGGFD